MFKKHPKGLLAASLSNMGERFGFYIMMAILIYFLMAKFGLSGSKASVIGSIFYCAIYLLALVGGIVADKTRKYKGTITMGIILMAVGYLIIALPTPTPVPDSQFGLYLTITCVGLFVIAFGNGLFKGNLQALVGQMYDNEKYGANRDSGFSLFYMFINVGAIFAPIVAVKVRGWWLKINGFAYNAELPEKCHQFLDGKMNGEGVTEFGKLAKSLTLNNTAYSDLTLFANDYLSAFTTGFHYAFAVAIIGMLISLGIFLLNKKNFPDPALKRVDSAGSDKVNTVEKMDPKEIKQRLYALFAVFAVVIFFWLSFHQNGHSLSLFAKDYTLLKIGSWQITAELFQSINPFFVVFLTPVVMALFGWLRAKGKEPSTPKKIAIGMGIAASAYCVLMLASVGLPPFTEMNSMPSGLPDSQRVTPFLLIGTYLILTIAELFISPLGLSFVSKVAPPHMQGLMQGCWLGTTAVANGFLWIGAFLYETIPVWATWAIFVGACLFSMFTMLFMLKWLERITK